MVHVGLVLLAVAVIVVGHPPATWNLWAIAIIGTFTVLSGLTYRKTSDRNINVQGTPLGLVLAAITLGAGPAACLGAVTIGFMQLRLRSPAHYLHNNLITFIWFPLIGALVFHGLVSVFAVGHQNLAFFVLIVPAFLAAITVNFIGAVGYSCWLTRTSLMVAVRDTLLPVIWVEMLASLLTVGAVWMTIHTGMLGLALLGLTFLVFQRLAEELLNSKQRARDLHRMATTDGLTGLVNRETFLAELSQATTAASAGSAFTVSLIDLDRFKDINDTLGHHYGDALLRAIARRLQECVGSKGTVARLGGDEFVVLSHEGPRDPEPVSSLAERLGECVREPVQIDEIVVSVGSSIGIARFPLDGRDVNELMRRADVAMYAAKDTHSGFKRYASELDHHSVRRLSLLGELAGALETNQIIVHYQPIISAEDLRTRGVECLVRWQHPKHGLLAPGAFIESVEQTPLIHALTLLVLERAIEQCAVWRRSGHDLSVAVNLSVRNLHNPGLPDDIATLLNRHGLEPCALKLEITESTLMTDPALVARTIAKLDALGTHLSVDDFGTGFSSLAYLKNLPITELKIDRSFVSAMLADESDLIIVRSTINLGHDLGLKVVAEGVEDAATRRKLSSLGCDLLQGYHISRPLPANELTSWLMKSSDYSSAQTDGSGDSTDPALPAEAG